jgi:hypothetical protein
MRVRTGDDISVEPQRLALAGKLKTGKQQKDEKSF